MRGLATLTVFMMVFRGGCTVEPQVPRPGRLGGVNSWICYYGNDRGVLGLHGPDLLVLDGDSIGIISDAEKRERVVLAYLSVGEAEEFRWYWKEIHGKDWILEENPHWEGDHLVDPRSAAWRELVVERVARRLIGKGYDGFLLDTLDTVDKLLSEEPLVYEGCAHAMVDLVKALRREYPAAVIVVNGGLSLVPGLASYIDGVMFEGVRSTYDLDSNAYRRRTEREVEWIGKRLERARTAGLPVLALEYVAPDSPDEAEAVAKEVRSLGYVPFVSEISLETYPHKVVPE